MKFLCRSDVWVNAVDLFGATALMYAAQQTDQRCLQYLLGIGRL